MMRKQIGLKIVGMFRGSAKGYLVLRGSSIEFDHLVVQVCTSDGGDLPCSIFPIRGEDRNRCGVSEVVVSFPLFESTAIRFSFSKEAESKVAQKTITLTQSRLKWHSRLLWRVKPRFCEDVLRAEANHNAEVCGGVEIAQVFDSDEQLIYRAWVTGEGFKGRDLLLRDGKGKTLSSPMLVIEETGGQNEGKVVSFSLDKELELFSIEASGHVFDAMDRIRRGELMTARDKIMVNPAIDERYPVKAGSVVREWSISNESAPSTEGSITFSIIVPLYRTPREYLKEMINSVVGQSYGAWELVLVNASPECEYIKEALSEYCDERIRIVELESNLGIAGNTNAGIACTSGDYVIFFDHDDILAPTLLSAYARQIEDDPEIDILYCDEDSFTTSDGPRFSPLFKPDLNRALLYSHNYVVHCLAVSKWALDKVDLSPSVVDGAQDYDLTLKILEHARKCKHIPEVLYHWRVHAGSTNGGSVQSKPYVIEAGKRALSDSFERRGVIAQVEPKEISCVYRVDMSTCKRGSVALLLVYRDIQKAEQFLESMKEELSDVSSLIIVGSHTNVLVPACSDFSPSFVRFVEWDEPYSFASMVNKAAEDIEEEILWICQDGIRSLGESHIDNLVGWLVQGEAGVVAPKLAYPDGLIQHAGLCIHSDGSIGYLNQNFTLAMGGGYLGTAECCCAYSAIAPDSFLCKKELFLKVEGLKSGGMNDIATIVDFCFKVRSTGGHVVVVPESILENYGHVIRADREECELSMQNPEITQLWETWGENYRQDVLYNPNVSIDSSYFQLL